VTRHVSRRPISLLRRNMSSQIEMSQAVGFFFLFSYSSPALIQLHLQESNSHSKSGDFGLQI
jgi:hypothetical protein